MIIAFIPSMVSIEWSLRSFIASLTDLLFNIAQLVLKLSKWKYLQYDILFFHLGHREFLKKSINQYFALSDYSDK